MFHFVSMHGEFKMSEMLTTHILKKLNDPGLEINPEVFEKLLATDGAASDHFGHSVVASADGLTVVVGAYLGDGIIRNSGSAYVFTKQANGNYFQAQKLLTSDGVVQDYFGCSVAISADGLVVVVGAFSGGDEGSGTGVTYVFTKQANGSYLQTQKLLASDGIFGDAFGNSVAISGDGSTIVVSANCDDDKGPDSGSAYIFTKQPNGSYLETQKLLGSDGASGDFFGGSVAVSGDGSTLVVGAYGDDDKGPDSGSAYIFTKQTDGNYLQTQKLSTSDGAVQDYFGCSVAISADGTTVAVGAFTGGGEGTGTVYVFTKQADGSYLETQKLVATDGAAYDSFGISVAVSENGSTVVIGAYGDDDKGIDSGSAYIFTKQSDGSYLQTQKLVASDGAASEHFGTSVAVSNTSVVIGAPHHLSKGAAYVY